MTDEIEFVSNYNGISLPLTARNYPTYPCEGSKHTGDEA
jgi:hypothetical protein